MRNLIKATVLGTALVLVAVAAPVRAADPYGTTGCSGIRPGALIEAPTNNFYTMGFLFRDQYGARYVSTAGDFVLPNEGKKTWKVGAGPKALNDARKLFGRFVYAVHQEKDADGTPAFDTFALVRLNNGVRYNAQMCHFGGPIGIYTSRSTGPIQMSYYGQGFPFDSTVPARTAIGTGTSDKNGVIGIGAPGFEDSGAPVLVGGRALGLITSDVGGGYNTAPVPAEAGNFLVTRFSKWISAAQKALHVKLYLLTAKTR